MASTPAPIAASSRQYPPSELSLQSHVPIAPCHIHQLQPSQALSPSFNPMISFSIPNKFGLHQKMDSASPETWEIYLARVAKLEARVQRLESHCQLDTLDSEGPDHHEHRLEENQENIKPKKKQKGTVGLQRLKEMEKQQVSKKKYDRRHDLAAARKQQRQLRDPNEGFMGPIESKSKVELHDLAYSLRLSLSGNKDDLITRIQRHFDKLPALRNDLRYSGLFLTGSASPSSQPSGMHLQVPDAPG